MTHTTTTEERPEVSDLAEWIALADSLIGHGLANEEFSGMSLAQWREQPTLDGTGFFRKSFAVSAIGGIAAKWVRGMLGPAGDGFAIRFEPMRPLRLTSMHH